MSQKVRQRDGIVRTNTPIEDPKGNCPDLNQCRGRMILVLDVLANGDINGVVEVEEKPPRNNTPPPLNIIYIPAEFLNNSFFTFPFSRDKH